MTDTNDYISVIMPVYNDPAGLATTVDSLLDQSFDNYEIIIVDNGSTDETADIALKYSEMSFVEYIVADEIQSSYAARNAGIEAAKGDIMAFIDADMWVESNWLELVQDRMKSTDAGYLGCDVIIQVDENTLVAKYNKLNGFPVKEYIENKNFAPTCCLVVRSRLFEEVGTFESHLISGGDVEFGQRVHTAGFTQEFAEDISMYHPARSSLMSLLKKHHRIGRGTIQKSRIAPNNKIRHPLHPYNFLPIKPWLIREKFRNESLFHQFIFFFIAYILKLSNSTGRVREWLQTSNSE